MSGKIWISTRTKRLARLDGQLQQEVDFGLRHSGEAEQRRMVPAGAYQVSATDWKTQRLEVHMNGRAMLFKTIARETSEVRGGFTAVPAGMNLAQGMRLLDPAESKTALAVPTALATSTAFTGPR